MKTICLMGMPRSGTSWLSQIFDSCPNVRFKLDPLFSYAFKDQMNEKSSKEDWNRFWQDVYHRRDDFLDQTEKRALGHYPTFNIKNPLSQTLVIKSTRYHHLIPSMLKKNICKFVYIIRNPCGAINSWLKSPGEFPKDANILAEWKAGLCRKTSQEEYWGFDDWCSTTLQAISYQQQYPKNFYILRYEDLIEQPINKSKEMFHFCDLPYTEQTNAFLTECHKQHISDQYAVYKSKHTKNAWKKELHPHIINEIYNAINNSILSKYLK